ncbi:MAG TPA: universal stress protein [Eoetvoesiella sp.]
MKSILVPVDGSASSLNAVKVAIKLQREYGAGTLYVINVQAPIISGNVTRFISSETINDFYQEEGEKMLTEARALLKDAGVVTEVSIQVGAAAKVIAEFAKKHECTAIIMGTRGLGGVSGLILGSVATKVLHLVDIPVTLVK